MKYGDAVVLVQKNPDGTLRRGNAIVLASSLHVPTTADRKPVLGADKKPVDPVEHLDLAFPVPSLAPDGGAPKTRNMDEIFRPAHDVPPYVEGAWVGYEVAEEADDRIEGSPRELVEQKFGEASEEIARLRQQNDGKASRITQLDAEIVDLKAENAKLKATPSAADLDAAAADTAAKEATT